MLLPILNAHPEFRKSLLLPSWHVTRAQFHHFVIMLEPHARLVVHLNTILRPKRTPAKARVCGRGALSPVSHFRHASHFQVLQMAMLSTTVSRVLRETCDILVATQGITCRVQHQLHASSLVTGVRPFPFACVRSFLRKFEKKIHLTQSYGEAEM